MSSFRPRNSTSARDAIETPAPCPECGKTALDYFEGPCKLGSGREIKRLRRLQCDSCGADFFDDAAMAVLEEANQSSAMRSL